MILFCIYMIFAYCIMLHLYVHYHLLFKYNISIETSAGETPDILEA